LDDSAALDLAAAPITQMCRAVTPVQVSPRPAPSDYFDLQPQEGAQLSGALAQLQGLQLQLTHLQASVFTASMLFIVTS
jgi:hypothetical protein